MKSKKRSSHDSKDRDMISIHRCEKILNSNGNYYTDEEIHKIRAYLYQLAEIQVRHFKQWQEDQLHVPPETQKDRGQEKISQDNSGQ